ncbi:MAG: Nif11-like leader peptide family natural product precursor [Cyanobacteria bacterium P01_A01_bin.116]
MSKQTVLTFLTDAAKSEPLKSQIEDAASQDELVGVAKGAGYQFSSQHVDEALADLKKQPGFFGALAEAALRIFSPHDDDYPATGMQPFTDQVSRKS